MVLLLWIICVFLSCVPHAFASVFCCLVVICWERPDFLALVGNVHCSFFSFPCGILGQVWYSIVSFPYLCRLSNLNRQPQLSSWDRNLSFSLTFSLQCMPADLSEFNTPSYTENKSNLCFTFVIIIPIIIMIRSLINVQVQGHHPNQS